MFLNLKNIIKSSIFCRTFFLSFSFLFPENEYLCASAMFILSSSKCILLHFCCCYEKFKVCELFRIYFNYVYNKEKKNNLDFLSTS